MEIESQIQRKFLLFKEKQDQEKALSSKTTLDSFALLAPIGA